MNETNVTFFIQYNTNMGECLHLLAENEQGQQMEYYQMAPNNSFWHITIKFAQNTTITYHYKYKVTEDGNNLRIEKGNFRSLVISNPQENGKINIYDIWCEHSSSFSPLFNIINMENQNKKISYDLICENKKIYSYQSPELIVNDSNEIKGSFNIKKKIQEAKLQDIYAFVEGRDNRESFAAVRFQVAEYNPRMFAIYLPLVSYRAKEFGDVGTFSAIKELCGFCADCGISQICVDIEYLNNNTTIDPVHIDCDFQRSEIDIFNIKTIRKLKIEYLQDQFSNANLKECKDFLGVIGYSVGHISDFEIYLQYLCYSQLQDAFVYAQEKRICLITNVLYYESQIKTNIMIASKYSNVVRIMPPNNNTASFDKIRSLKNSIGLPIAISSDISEKLNDNMKDKESQIIFSGIDLFPDFPDNYMFEAKYISPAALSEFPDVFSREKIRTLIERRINSPCISCMVYFYDLLYLFLPEVTRKPPQSIQSKKDHERFIFPTPISEIHNGVKTKIKNLLDNGERIVLVETGTTL